MSKRVKKRVKYLYEVIMESDIASFNVTLSNFGKQGYAVKLARKLPNGWWALMQKRIWVKEEDTS